MDRNEIIAEYEDLDRIVKNFADGIGSFLDRMSSNAADINTAMSVLFSAWTGAAADSFRSNMERHIAVIQGSTDRAEQLRDKLNTVSAKLAQALAAFREGGNLQ